MEKASVFPLCNKNWLEKESKFREIINNWIDVFWMLYIELWKIRYDKHQHQKVTNEFWYFTHSLSWGRSLQPCQPCHPGTKNLNQHERKSYLSTNRKLISNLNCDRRTWSEFGHREYDVLHINAILSKVHFPWSSCMEMMGSGMLLSLVVRGLDLHSTMNLPLRKLWMSWRSSLDINNFGGLVHDDADGRFSFHFAWYSSSFMIYSFWRSASLELFGGSYI